LNTVPIAEAISLSEGKRFGETWHNCYFWSFPFYLVGASVAWIISLFTRQMHWQGAIVLLPVIYLIYRSYQLYLARLEDERRHVESIAGLHMRTIEALALAIEAKDHTTHEHLRRVRVYAVEVGKQLGLSERELEALKAAALLHDIGKLAVPEHIISKPGRLTQEEFEKMKIHPVVGAEILERVSFPYPVAPIVRAHHEKWDGTGYPYGLRGEEIPIGARILSAVDCLDALASDRQYRRAWPGRGHERGGGAGRQELRPEGGADLEAALCRAGAAGAGDSGERRQTVDRRENRKRRGTGRRLSRRGAAHGSRAMNTTFCAPSPRPGRKCSCCLNWCRIWATPSAWMKRFP
jgi:putative nucleotidyltransferase with HDIG domain